jgi:uncharacterized membrane protein (DUF373 family)
MMIALLHLQLKALLYELTTSFQETIEIYGDNWCNHFLSCMIKMEIFQYFHSQ